MLFVRNPQVFWEPIAKADGSNLRVAIEAPGASGDAGTFADRVELQNVRGRFPAPDFTGHYRAARGWGYLQVGAAIRKIAWDDVLDDGLDLSGDAVGWGINLSSILKLSKASTVRLQYVFGEGIQNYMNDSPVDVGLVNNLSNPIKPVRGDTVPIVGLVAFVDHRWNEKFTSSIGYSMLDIDNSNGQTNDAFNRGHYALANLLYYPVKDLMVGGEPLSPVHVGRALGRYPSLRIVNGYGPVEGMIFINVKR
jgi:hypothetical protein